MAEDQVPPPPPADPVEAAAAPTDEVPKDTRTMGMLCHLLGIFSGFVGPLIIWLIKKDEMPFVDDQGRESLNFQITLAIAFIVLFVVSLIPIVGCFTFLLLIALWVVDVVFCIIAAMKANEGIAYRYPVTIRFVK